MDLGSAIRIGRTFKKITQKELAKKLSVTQTMVGYYERNLHFPRKDKLKAILQILDIEEVSKSKGVYNVKLC